MNRTAVILGLGALGALLLGRNASAASTGSSSPSQPGPPMTLEGGRWYTFTALAPEGMSQPEAVSFIEEWGGQILSARPGKRVALAFNWGPEQDTHVGVPGPLGEFYIQTVRPADSADSESEA